MPTPESRASLLEALFLRFGSGAHLLRPLIHSRHWNTIAWILIAFGVAGWIAFFFWAAPLN